MVGIGHWLIVGLINWLNVVIDDPPMNNWKTEHWSMYRAVLLLFKAIVGNPVGNKCSMSCFAFLHFQIIVLVSLHLSLALFLLVTGNENAEKVCLSDMFGKWTNL
mgnify:CR=1 FL=1